jgi:opacity protein-like surface antigen
MLRIVTSVFIAMATLCVSNLARAQEDYSRAGWYLGLGGVVGIPISAEDEFVGLDARGGYRGKWGGGDLHFEWAGGDDDDFENDFNNNYDWALTLDGKLYYLAGLEDWLHPLARRLQPFFTAGFGTVYFDHSFRANSPKSGSKHWDFAIRAGSGLDVYLTRNIAVSVDWTYVRPMSTTLNDLDYHTIGWGFLYRF